MARHLSPPLTYSVRSRALLSAITCHEGIQQYLSGADIEWVFNIEKAPWWGGIFERMVRSTKRCLKKMIGRAQLSYDEILTAVTEVEAIINSRPLSYVSTDDLEEPLNSSRDVDCSMFLIASVLKLKVMRKCRQPQLN